MFARTPEPPYYAVIFTTTMTGLHAEEYAQAAERMEELARSQPGYLGIESARAELGITVSYWKDLDSIAAWKQQLEHAEARRRGRSDWYASYHLRVARVERDYDFVRPT